MSASVPRGAAHSGSGEAAANAGSGLPFLSAKDAAALDDELMGSLGFCLEQLMELAGLSVAAAVAEVYPPSSHGRALVLCGPGNNGGDGLVAARHLMHFGYQPTVCYPKRPQHEHYARLVKQLEVLGVPFAPHEELLQQPLSQAYDVAVDAAFGFSFKGAPRPPFDELLAALAPAAQPPPVVAVDVPSGWTVDEGDPTGEGLRPQVLVSLTAPKPCAGHFTGEHHFLGGRFVPPVIKRKYGLVVPDYPGAAQIVRLGP